MNAKAGASVPDMAALPAGHTLNEYRIDRVLGGGGFGITYLARDVNLELPVALKEYYPANVAVRGDDLTVQVRSAEARERFEWGLERFIDEARALASFRHPNIVRVLRYFKDHGTAYIVMEYESGDPLKVWVARQPGLDRTRLLNLVFPLLEGLEAVHRLNFLHRDIKPDNIYIRADGSPVLLDFGAARRVSAEQDMTNIVSPGFAPFEQYHTRGNQGPWTDLYSLGAVMYWLTTGLKPVEAAARVREDAMPRAIDAGSRAAFGPELLQAIDWALSPDEKSRPQTVAEFRDALRKAAERLEPPTELATELVSRVQERLVESSHSQAGSTDNAQRRNVLSTIMFMDLVGYSKRSVDQQVTVKTMFNELIGKAVASVDSASRIMLDTGDGAAICFLGDPEEALVSAQLLRDLLKQKYSEKLSLRVGLNLGPVRLLKDINGRTNVVGDGINVAQRIMDFANPGQITVSRAYYDIVARISEGGEALFEYLGERQDKHQRVHAVYGLVDQRGLAGSPSPSLTQTLPMDRVVTPSAEEVSRIDAELVRLIGPLAHVLVKKAMPKATDGASLRELLAVSIPDELARESFLAGRPITVSVRGTSTRASGISRPVSTTGSRSMSAGVGASGRHSGLPPTQALHFEATRLEPVERALSQFIGPLARTLVRREAARHAAWPAFIQALAQHIDKPDDRQRFTTAALRS